MKTKKNNTIIIAEAGINHNGNIKVFPVDDTMCMSYCTNLGKVQNHKLDTLAHTELNYTTIKYEDLCGKGVNQKTFDLINPLEALNYAAEDSDVALALYQNLKLRLMSDKKYDFEFDSNFSLDSFFRDVL